jgi:hypothetical protein
MVAELTWKRARARAAAALVAFARGWREVAWPKVLLGAGGWLLIALAGYFLTYQLFFAQTPVESFSRVVEGGVEGRFRYDGVVYFKGRVLRSGETLVMKHYVPRVVALATPGIEFFLETSEDHDQPIPLASAGTLRISGLAEGEPVEVELGNAPLQRFTLPWRPETGARNTIEIEYLAQHPDAQILIATNVVAMTFWFFILAFLALGLVALFLANERYGGQRQVPDVRHQYRWLLVVALLGFYVHSGAFISNDMFHGHGTVSLRPLQAVFESGTLGERTYRQAGFLVFVPFITYATELSNQVFKPDFQDFFPTSRYVMFSLFMVGVLYLTTVVRTILGLGVASLFALLAVTHFPFIVDLYFPDADAYFIFVFPAFLALALKLIFRIGSTALNFAGLLVVVFFMGTVKITPAFLILLLPVTLVCASWRADRTFGLKLGAVAFASMLGAFQVGAYAEERLQNPDRNVGIEGERFQNSVLWHILWAAYGAYDSFSAHGFTKSGSLRNERVSARTGLPVTTYLRQSQTAAEKVYKPDLQKAWSERPGYFYSTAFVRMYRDGIRFFRYTRGADPVDWERWIDGKKADGGSISGERVSRVTPELEAIRYGEAWKFSPLILLAKLTQKEITFFADLLLLGAGVVGVVLFKNGSLRILLLGLILAQLGFSTAVHAVNRYFMFCDFALLLGLAHFLRCGFLALKASAREPGLGVAK